MRNLGFFGNSITYEYTKYNNRGNVAVYIDGSIQASFSAYDPDNIIWRVRKTFELSNGPHVIEVRRSDSSPSTYMDNDAFLVNWGANSPGSYEDTHTDISYLGTWTHGCCYSGPSGGNISWSTNINDTIVFTFQGDGIRYYYTKYWNRGTVKVTIDGVEKDEIDLYSASTQWQQSKHYILAQGTHTINLTVMGDGFIDLDKFVVD